MAPIKMLCLTSLVYILLGAKGCSVLSWGLKQLGHEAEHSPASCVWGKKQ